MESQVRIFRESIRKTQPISDTALMFVMPSWPEQLLLHVTVSFGNNQSRSTSGELGLAAFPTRNLFCISVDFTSPVDLSDSNKWIKFNKAASGYYMVNYPESMWGRFYDILSNDPEVTSYSVASEGLILGIIIHVLWNNHEMRKRRQFLIWSCLFCFLKLSSPSVVGHACWW